MPLTLAELEARVNQFSNRVNALATSSEVQELLTLLNTYKTATDASLNDLTSRLDQHDSQLADHESRLQALE
ncbi:MAG: hypothetical protein E6R03_08125 [Hyphomicrobiaceae bacterium]|nr:MAG: hypothetical protein E6R03_08125 [Hyphomicrobiaceae bacterium]